ncbi:angio-associated migratory cell protein-like [Mytilus edulis]|uniref:angio-associated migratory cell protein-like n=1 Tax=Mytilus edulis TaxID=6550 RepID=UPI0039F14235
MENENVDDTGDADLEFDEDEIVEIIEINEGDGLLENLDSIDIDDGDDEGGEEGGADGLIDSSSFVFKQHTDAVFTVSVDKKSSNLVVTGGQDDRGFVWSANTGEQIMECNGFKDSVTCVGFSPDGSMVAMADLSGVIRVYDVETKKEVWSFECSDTEWLQWHPVANVLLLGTTDGDVWMWKVPSGDCKTFQGPGCTANCGRILPDGKRLCVGYDNGLVKIWDLKDVNTLHSFNPGREGHGSSVVCMDCHHDNTRIMTGSTDVTSRLYNANTGKLLGSLDCKNKESTDENSVETCGFSKIQNYAATGTLLGTLCIWDVPTQTARNVCPHEAGIVKLKWDAISPLIYTACLDGVLRLWDSRNGQCVTQWAGHQDAILDFDISSDGNTLISVSEDKTARVFSLHTPDR